MECQRSKSTAKYMCMRTLFAFNATRLLRVASSIQTILALFTKGKIIGYTLFGSLSILLRLDAFLA